jgi:hypothetical protein
MNPRLVGKEKKVRANFTIMHRLKDPGTVICFVNRRHICSSCTTLVLSGSRFRIVIAACAYDFEMPDSCARRLEGFPKNIT